MKKLDIKKQDLLESIYEKILICGKARLTDIAIKLNFSKSRTSQEVKKLKIMGFVVEDKYSPLKLTELGKFEAERVLFKHHLIKNYLKTILKVSEITAEKDACAIEHILREETIKAIFEKLKKTNNYVNKFNLKESEKYFTKKILLKELKINQKAQILQIQSNKKTKKMLMERGIIKGEIIKLIRRGPFGDPLEFRINDYKFFLGVKESEKIIIKLIKES